MLNFTHFNSLIQVIKHFSSEKNCYSFLTHQRWKDGVVRCPYCGSTHIAHRNDSKQPYRCEKCNRSFSVLVGTIFENTKLPISKWIIGMYLISSHKNGISSVQLAKDIEVTQTTAWYMLHRVRTLMKQDEDRKLSGDIECDEMYLGGRETNKHNNQKTEKTQGRSTKTKTPIFGMVETTKYIDEKGNPRIHTYARVQMVSDCKSKTLINIIENNVANGSNITTDELGVYCAIDRSKKQYNHAVVCHKDREFTNKEGFTTNRIEGFWGGFKRMVFGTYHMVNRSYLSRYIDESAFRYNTKELTEGQRFELMFDIAFGKKCQYCEVKMVS